MHESLVHTYLYLFKAIKIIQFAYWFKKCERHRTINLPHVQLEIQMKIKNW